MNCSLKKLVVLRLNCHKFCCVTMKNKQKTRLQTRLRVLKWLKVLQSQMDVRSIPEVKLSVDSWHIFYMFHHKRACHKLSKESLHRHLVKIQNTCMLEGFEKTIETSPKYEVYFELKYNKSDLSLQDDSDKSDKSDKSFISDRSCSDQMEYQNIFPDYHDPFACHDPFSSSQLLLSAIKNIEDQNISILSDNYVVNQTLPEPSQPLEVNMPSRFPLISDLASHQANELIAISKGLDLSESPCVALHYTEDESEYFIPIQEDLKRLSEPMKWSLISLCCDLGCTDARRDRRLKIFKAVIKVQSYVYGFPKEAISVDHFERQWRKFKDCLVNNPGNTFKVYLSRAGQNRISYVKNIMGRFPTLLHGLFCQATAILGPSANTQSIIHFMNRQCRVLHPDCPYRRDLTLTKFHFWEFFHSNGGILKAPTSKPRLTPEQRKLRVSWALTWLLRLKRKMGPIVCYLDEKWFWTASRRKVLKILPKASFETEEEAFVPQPKLRSRRHATKVMFMGIVAPPVETCGFDGKILIKRVSEIKNTTKISHNKKISDEFAVNHLLKDNEWVTPYCQMKTLMQLIPKSLFIKLLNFITLTLTLKISFTFHTIPTPAPENLKR